MEFARHLERLDDYPRGTREDWVDRYEPLVDEIVTHRALDAPRLSAVVVAWRAEDFLLDCLDRLHDQVGVERDDVEIVLVDNGGNDAIRDELAERVDLEVRMKGNAGLCRARNLGVALAAAEIVAFIDDDGLVECDYVRNGLRHFDDPDVVASRTRIVAREHPYFTTLATHYSRGAEVVDDCLVTEGSSFVRRGPFVEVGGFAEDMSGHEGIDLTFRLLQRDPNARVVYVPDVVMHHDYVDGWKKFGEKNWRYSRVTERTQRRSTELSEFMDDYFERSFDRAPLTADERVAREALKFVRTVMKAGAAVQRFVTQGAR